MQLIESASGGVQTTASSTVTVTGTITGVAIAKPGVLHVTVSGPGTLKLRGRRFSAPRFGTITVKLPLTAGQKRRLRRHHALTLTVSMTFAPAGGTAIHVSKRLTLRG